MCILIRILGDVNVVSFGFLLSKGFVGFFLVGEYVVLFLERFFLKGIGWGLGRFRFDKFGIIIFFL